MAAQRFRGRRGAGGTSKAPGGNGGKPPGGFKEHGAVLFSRKRLIEASARTGAPLPPASRIHPRLPAANPPNTHPSCAGSQWEAEHGGASPRANRSSRRSSPVPHGLFGFIYHTVHRSLVSEPRKDFIPPPRSSILLAHTHRAHPGAQGWQRPGADRTDPALRRPPDRWLITFTAAFCAGIEFQTMSQFYLISQFSSLMRAVTATPKAGAFFFFFFPLSKNKNPIPPPSLCFCSGRG